MTIQTEDRKAGPFPGDGVTVNFDFGFKVFAETDVLVIQAVTATGAETQKTITTDYTVTLNPNQESSPGGRVTMLVAPPAGQTITLTSEVPNLQGKTITSLGGFFPQVLNDALDRLTVLVQQVRRDVARSVKVNLSSTTTPDQLLADINNSVLAADVSAAAAAGSAVAADASADAAALSAGSASADLATAQSMLLAAKLGAGADIASAATLDLTGRTGNLVRITGTNTVTALTMNNGDMVLLEAVGALPISVSGVLTYTCAAGDNILVWQDGNGTQGAYVMRSDGLPRIDRAKIQSIPAPTFNAGDMTIPAQSYTLDFQNPSTGAVTTVAAAVAAMVIPSGATLGLVSGVQSELALLALFPSAGTIEYAITNVAGGVDLSETGTISTTALSTGSDSANVVYSTTARSNVQYRVLGRYRSIQTTAGTWAQSMSAINGAGTQGLTSMGTLGYGQTWQNVTGSRALGTTYYNTTGKPITLAIQCSAVNTIQVAINGINFGFIGNTNNTYTYIVPPNGSYAVTGTSATFSFWNELR